MYNMGGLGKITHMKRFLHLTIGSVMLLLGTVGVVFCVYFLFQGWIFPVSIILIALALVSLGALIVGIVVICNKNISTKDIRDMLAGLLSGLLSL